MHVCSGLLRAYPIEVVTTKIRAIAKCIPQFLPFFTPLEGSLTYQANLGGRSAWCGIKIAEGWVTSATLLPPSPTTTANASTLLLVNRKKELS